MSVGTTPALRSESRRLHRVALAGNPNSGKTTLFNALTGLRQKVGNYPGVTVEKKEGRLLLDDHEVTLVDLPGAYSLEPRSPDEEITRDVLLGRRPDTPVPDLIVAVVDAGNLERNLYLVAEILELGLPVLVAVNLVDAAEQQGVRVDTDALARELGVPVYATVAHRARGVADLRQALACFEAPGANASTPRRRRWRMRPELEDAVAELADLLTRERSLDPARADAEAIALLTNDQVDRSTPGPTTNASSSLIVGRWSGGRPIDLVVGRLLALGIDPAAEAIEARYAWLTDVCRASIRRSPAPVSLTDRIDAVLTHRFWGALVFLGVMALAFQAILSWATVPMDAIDGFFGGMKSWVQGRMPAGDLRDLITEGVIAGVGGVLVFLPQILFLFFFIGLLEESGYMARAAFLTDRVMSRVGLHGKSFIPLLSSFACAVPGIMATRTIENRKDRLVTILIAPLMSCSARLPVYMLMIGAFLPARPVLGFLTLPTVTLLAMYLLGFVAAMAMAALFKRTLLRSETPTFIMELPPYRVPQMGTVGLTVWSATREFLVRAGTVILAISICIWFLTAYPKTPGAGPGEQLANSFAGRIGHAMEPVLRPLGFDWKIGIGIIGATAAREVFVSTMATVYSVAAEDEEEAALGLRAQMKRDIDPHTGRPVWTPLVAVALMVYFVLAMQCMSTVAVVRRETGGWRWPLFQILYMTALAYAAALVVYQGGRLLGWG